MKGLIIIGYQGIGKSSHAGKDNCIDLESGNFWIGGKRYDDWHIPYCQLAMDLASQGYTVFTSSHKKVRDHLENMPLPENVGKVVIFCPKRSMKDEWINKLSKRYEATRLNKDYKALMNAVDRFEENIVELIDCSLPVYQPEAMDYDLHNYIVKMRNDWCINKEENNGDSNYN